MKKLLFLIFLLLLGCGKIEKATQHEPDPVPEIKKEAKFQVTAADAGYDTVAPFIPWVSVTIKNVGNNPAYNVYCNIHVVRDGVIVDTAFLYFANGGTINVGQSATKKGYFFVITSFKSTDKSTSECNWLNR